MLIPVLGGIHTGSHFRLRCLKTRAGYFTCAILILFLVASDRSETIRCQFVRFVYN